MSALRTSYIKSRLYSMSTTASSSQLVLRVLEYETAEIWKFTECASLWTCFRCVYGFAMTPLILY